MTFLDLCRLLRQEAGIAGDGPNSTSGQTGPYKKVVDWVRRAYASVQTARQDWDFLWFEDSFALPIGSREVAMRDIDLRFKSVVRDSVRIQTLAGQTLPVDFVSYERFKEKYLTSSPFGLPCEYTITPNRKIKFSSAPDFDAVVYLEGHLSPHEFSANTDQPVFDAEFHEIILYRALMYYAANEEAGNIYQDAKANFDEMYKRMELHYLQTELELPGPLA